MHCNGESFQLMIMGIILIMRTIWSITHAVWGIMQKYCNRIMQRIMNIITSALSQYHIQNTCKMCVIYIGYGHFIILMAHSCVVMVTCYSVCIIVIHMHACKLDKHLRIS